MKLTWKKTLAVWWSLFWRGALLGGLFGSLIGGVVGGVMGAKGDDQNQIQGSFAMVGAGYAGGLIASFVAVKLALQKHLPGLVAIAGSSAVAKPVVGGDEGSLG